MSGLFGGGSPPSPTTPTRKPSLISRLPATPIEKDTDKIIRKKKTLLGEG